MASVPHLRIGTYRYDTTRALFDGSVTVDGATVEVGSQPALPQIFKGLVQDGSYDVAELGLTFYLRLLDVDDTFVAIPAFPNRLFRHSAVYVNRASGITGPADLVDRTIGEFGFYGQDPGIWIKGILMDEYGFRPERNRWVIGPLEATALPFDFFPQPSPPGVEITTAPAGAALGAMLAAGEIDALFSANVPQVFTDGHPDVVRLFEDYEQRERDYFRRTGIFPIMHAVAAPRALFERHRGLAGDVYDAFLRSKDAAATRYRDDQKIYEVSTMLPWANALFERNRRLLPEDWWPYGVAANRAALETYLRYFHEQGLTSRRREVAELFVPELLDT